MTALDIHALISHRFRGFSEFENTLEGLRAALDFGVQNLEFDVRVAKCGTLMIYHDEYAQDGSGQNRKLCEHKASEYADIGGAFSRMPTFDALLEIVKAHKNTTARLLIDIKDYGFEGEIHALVMMHRLAGRVVYVSWLPDVLYRLHEMAPNIPLCLSHWCMPANADIKASHHVHVSKDGHITRGTRNYIIGERSGWAVLKSLAGDMLSILRASGGGVCVPQNMITRDLTSYYHAHKMFVTTFSYTDWDAINAHKNRFNIDLYFIDNKQVFDDLA